MVTFSELGRHGEFGNQLFQIAATVGHAVKSNQSYIFPKWQGLVSGHQYSQYFEYPIMETDSLLNCEQIWNEPHFHYCDIPIIEENLNLFGYFQSEKYFKHCEDVIRKTFTPNKILKNINLLDYKNTVCIQLRFYDNNRPYSTRSLRLDPQNDFYYNVEDNLDFFKKAINYFGKGKIYFIVTNNPDKAEQMFGKYDNFYIMKNYNYIEQFFIQTKCEHNIISNSSFGWWGAWLNQTPDKVVFAPTNWFKNKEMLTNDLYPSEWMLL